MTRGFCCASFLTPVAPVAAQDEGRAYPATFHGWFTGLKGRVDTPAGTARTGVTMTVLSAFAAYRAVDAAQATVEIAGGLRWNDMDVDARLTGGPVPGTVPFDGTRPDPLVTARV